jgi:hypothetical protein
MRVREQVYFGEPADFTCAISPSTAPTSRSAEPWALSRSSAHGQTPDDLLADRVYSGARRAYMQRHFPIHAERLDAR